MDVFLILTRMPHAPMQNIILYVLMLVIVIMKGMSVPDRRYRKCCHRLLPS